MKKFIDNVQNVILDIRYENKILEMMNDLPNEPVDEYEEELLELMLDEEPQDPSRDIYGNIIGAPNPVFPMNGYIVSAEYKDGKWIK